MQHDWKICHTDQISKLTDQVHKYLEDSGVMFLNAKEIQKKGRGKAIRESKVLD